MRKIIIGVMGPGKQATAEDLQNAYQLGQLIAQKGWVLLTGGRNVGVMDAASKGAKSANGLTVGILPDDNADGVSEAVDIAIATDLGNARNNINVLSSHIAIACGISSGTASEIALAIKANKPVILLSSDRASQSFFQNFNPQKVYIVNSPELAINITSSILGKQQNLMQ